MKSLFLFHFTGCLLFCCTPQKNNPDIDPALLTGTWKLRESGSYSGEKRLSYGPDSCRLQRNYEIREDHTATYHYFEGEDQDCRETIMKFSWNLKGDTLTLQEAGQNPYKVRIVNFTENRMTLDTFPAEADDQDTEYSALMKTIFYEDLEKIKN